MQRQPQDHHWTGTYGLTYHKYKIKDKKDKKDKKIKMTTLNLTGQNLEREDILPKIIKLKSLMNERKTIWDKLPYKKQNAWVMSDKDPIMALAWSVHRYLKDFFKGLDDGTN